MMRPLRLAAARVGVAALSLALTLFVLEVGLRAATAALGESRVLSDLETLPPEEAPPKLAGLHEIRLSSNPRILYELVPNRRALDSAGNVYTINASGFRGPDHPVAKDASTVRIVGLGDSYMFGFGVSDDEVFMERLSRSLAGAYPEASWQLVNTAVGGYNTMMEVETLKERGLRYAPDLVFILFVGNDLALPNFIREPGGFFTRRSLLLELVNERLDRSRGTGLIRAPYFRESEWLEGIPDGVPREYRDMAGLEAYRQAMRTLKELSVRHGFEVIVLQQNVREIVTSTCAELGLPLVRFHPALTAYMQEHGIEKFRGSVLSVSEADPHPSAEAHRIFAEVILDHLERSGAIDRALARIRGSSQGSGVAEADGNRTRSSRGSGIRRTASVSPRSAR